MPFNAIAALIGRTPKMFVAEDKAKETLRDFDEQIRLLLLRPLPLADGSRFEPEC